MKIIKIKFKNINNLKGEHEAIRFDQDPLASAGIFAITGPTGSGKSTLLDVITLSLFNRIPRYNRGISKKEIESLGSVVTHHTNDAFASVEYEIKGNRFTSEWKVSKNRHGKFKDYEMFLYDSSGKPIDLKKSEVPAKNEELIGLEYNQFIKSILLSQGQFSKFLQADQNERGQLLENITGTSIYRKIGKKVFEKQKDFKQKLETKKEILANFQTLKDEEIKLIKQELAEATKLKSILDEKLKILSNNIQVKKDLKSTTLTIEQLQSTAQSLKLKQEKFSPKQSKLKIHNKLAPIKDDIALYIDADQNRLATNKNLNEYQAQMAIARTGLKQSLSSMSSLCKTNVDKENFMQIMRDFENEIIALDKDLDNCKSKGLEIRERIGKQSEHYKYSLDHNPQLAIEFLENKISQRKIDLKNANISTKANSEEIKETLKKQKEIYDQVLLIKHDLDQIVELNATNLNAQKKLAEQQNIITEKTPIKDKSEKLIKSLSDQITLLEKSKENAIKIASLEEHRKTLIDGEACPLCGSLEHPYSIHQPEEDQQKINNQITIIKSEINQQDIELKNLIKTLSTSEASIKIIKTNLLENQQKINEIQQSLDKKTRVIKNKTEIDNREIENTIKNLGIKINQLEDAVNAIEELRRSADLKDLFQNLKTELNKYQEIKNLRFSKFEGDKIGPITNKIQNDFQKFSESITRLDEAIEIESKDLNRALDSLEKHKIKLQPKLESLGFNSIDEMNENFLSEEEANKLLAEENILTKSWTQNETKLKSEAEKLNLLISKDKQKERNLEELLKEYKLEEKQRDQISELIGQKNNQLNIDKENKNNQKSQLKEIESLAKEVDKWSLMTQIIGDATGNKFANFSQGLTLQNLLVYANQRLTKLSDRYLLDIPVDGGPLRVMDQYQGNSHRSVSTLSGGESFLISLALALSLSDMASRNVSIESLFIDEGFGTLDQETLDIAMNTLEKLQTESQKMVGVISHVEALKERIAVQIKLEKNAQGFSNIQVVQN